MVIEGVKLAHGHEQVLAALQANLEFAECRRRDGERAARATSLGQAISHRFKRDEKGWRVFVTTKMTPVPAATDRRRGAIGVDRGETAPVADTAVPCSVKSPRSTHLAPLLSQPMLTPILSLANTPRQVHLYGLSSKVEKDVAACKQHGQAEWDRPIKWEKARSPFRNKHR